MAKQLKKNGITPRVLWVSHAFGYGGDLMYFGEIFRHFQNLFPNMGVVVDKDTPYRNDYKIHMLPIMRLFRKPLRRTTPEGQVYESEIAFPSPLLMPRLAMQQADVLIAIEFTLPALMATLVTTVMPGKKLLLLVESDPAARGGSTNPWVRRVKSWAVRRADAIQTNNEKGRRYLIEGLGASPDKVLVAPYLTSRPPGPPTIPVAHGGPLRLLFANSITQRKGLAELFAAIERLTPAVRKDVELTIVGDGPERTQLEAIAARMGMGDRLRFVGKCSYRELGPYYAKADILVIPSLADYRSLAGFEGLGYGLALLSSINDGATEETVENGVNGFTIDPANPDQIAMHIAELAADRVRVLQMREASLALYKRSFSMERIAENLRKSVTIAAISVDEEIS